MGAFLFRAISLFVVGLFCLLDAAVIPRKVISFYDGYLLQESVESRAHKFFELPLNHLGFILEHRDLHQELPDLYDPDLRALLLFFPAGYRLSDPVRMIDYLERAIDHGVRVIMIGDPGFRPEESDNAISPMRYRNFFRKLGIDTHGDWHSLTYDCTIVKKDFLMTAYERDYIDPLPPFRIKKALEAQSFLKVQLGNQEIVDLILIHPRGAWIANGYAIYSHFDEKHQKEYRHWYINPLEFLRQALLSDELPKPDVTTMAGRRIYYSHIDGDGWNNISLADKYRKKGLSSAQVVFEEAIVPFPELPVTVAPVAADLDPNWEGSKESQETARRYFGLDQVELGSHTYSHPFFWKFFENYEAAQEKGFLHLYRRVSDQWTAVEKQELGLKDFFTIYKKPRAFAYLPFDLQLEVQGSKDFIESFAPKGKKVTCYMWSGDIRPFLEAVDAVNEAGLCHINGGDSRFDQEYPSLAWVAPFGRIDQGRKFVYASNSNENTYTFLWTDRFYGQALLKETLERTESPKRFKPHNLYYHFYAGEKEASLQALIGNLQYAKKASIIALETSFYCKIVEGFFDTKIERLTNNSWQVSQRSNLNTIRFDQGIKKEIDFLQSKGVVGQRHYQGSLYVYLDETVEQPQIVLGEQEPEDFYLLEGSWRVFSLQREQKACSFQTKGFGPCDLSWHVPLKNHKYRLLLGSSESFVHSDEEGQLKISLPASKETLKISLQL